MEALVEEVDGKDHTITVEALEHGETNRSRVVHRTATALNKRLHREEVWVRGETRGPRVAQIMATVLNKSLHCGEIMAHDEGEIQ